MIYAGHLAPPIIFLLYIDIIFMQTFIECFEKGEWKHARED